MSHYFNQKFWISHYAITHNILIPSIDTQRDIPVQSSVPVAN